MKRCIFIGQAMPKKKSAPHNWPSLNSWLYSININDQQINKYFLYSALVNYFPGSIKGSHKIPSKKEIDKERKRLVKTIKDYNPDITVPVGRISISYCLGQKVLPLDEVIGNIYYSDPYKALGKIIKIIPLPHPSGASTWYNKPNNNKLLLNSLNLLKSNLL